MKFSRKAWILLCCFLAATTALLAQSESGRAALEGRVTDPSGKLVPVADVSVRQMQTGFSRKIATNAEGEFRIGALPVGTYRVDVAAPGFGASAIENLALTVGETKTVNFVLQLASVSETVTVSTEAQIVNESDPSNGVTINQLAIRDLPIRGRNFTEFLQLTPNVMQEQDRFGIVVNGQRSINSNISIDGVDFNDSLQGGQRGGNDATYVFPQAAIREFQVVRTGATAEVGRTNAGFVNVVTNSGTNQYHGEGFYANRNGAMTSPDAFNNPSNDNSQHQFGGSIGGPIRKDRLFFFAALEKNLLTVPYTVKFNTPSTPGLVIPQSILSQQGTFAGKNNPLAAFGRMDYQLNSANSLNVQYTYAGLSGLNFGDDRSALTSAAVSNNAILDRRSQGVKAGLTTVLSSSLLNEVRGQWAYDNRYQIPNSPLPEVDINDFGTLGGYKDGSITYKATRYEVLDNLSWTRGVHNLRFGIDMNFNPQYQTRETSGGGVYTFNTLADYLAGKIQQFVQAIPGPSGKGFYKAMQQDHAFFAQDTIKARRDLTVTVGFRWEGQLEPQPVHPNPKYPITGQVPNDLSGWQPRLGIAYNVGGKGTTVVRLSAGIYNARTPAYLVQRAFTDNGLDVLIVDSAVDPSVLNYLTIPNGLNSLPSGVALPLNTIFAFDPAFRNPRSFQAAATLEQQLDRNTKVIVGYTRNSTWHLQRRLDRNLFPPTLDATGTPIYPKGPASTGGVLRPDPTIGQLNVNESTAHSDYNGLTITVQRRMTHRFQFLFNYSYSATHDDDSNERDFRRQLTLDTYNLKLDAGYSKQDIRHNGNINGLYQLPWGLTASALILARTGQPVKPIIGSDVDNDGNKDNDVPVINGHVPVRNGLYRQPGFFDMDLRLLKEFKIGERARLSISVEGFNITRSSNKNFGSDVESKFGKPTTTVNPNTGLFFANNTALIPTLSPTTDRFGGPRQVQLGMRFIF